MSIGGASAKLQGHDLVVVIGAQIFRYYAYVAGTYLPEGTELLHITADPGHAGSAPVGDSLLGDTCLALEALLDVVDARPPAVIGKSPPVSDSAAPAEPPLALRDVYAALASAKTADTVMVNEATSTMAQRRDWLPVSRPASYYTTPSGGLGWAMPAAVGIALADRAADVRRPVLVTIGDGSFQYSVQSLWTAAQHSLPIAFVVLANGEYAVLKSFAHLENTPGVPGLDIPGLDIVSMAAGFGCKAVRSDTPDQLIEQLTAAQAGRSPHRDRRSHARAARRPRLRRRAGGLRSARRSSSRHRAVVGPSGAQGITQCPNGNPDQHQILEKELPWLGRKDWQARGVGHHHSRCGEQEAQRAHEEHDGQCAADDRGARPDWPHRDEYGRDDLHRAQPTGDRRRASEMKDPAHQWAVFDEHFRVHLHVLAESDPGQDDDQPVTSDQLARLGSAAWRSSRSGWW